MACPHVHGDCPRAIASGLSSVQVDSNCKTILYTTLVSVALAYNESCLCAHCKGRLTKLEMAGRNWSYL